MVRMSSFIHVLYLAYGHLKALDVIALQPRLDVWNVGTGRGYSVLEVIRAFEPACGMLVPCQLTRRRTGDVAECWADPTNALKQVGWKAERGLPEMMADAWRWQSRNPEGYSNQSDNCNFDTRI
jgi:UDP-glucose 4-epimerase